MANIYEDLLAGLEFRKQFTVIFDHFFKNATDLLLLLLPSAGVVDLKSLEVLFSSFMCFSLSF